MIRHEFWLAARVYWQEDYQLHIHVSGDKGLNILLAAIEKLQNEHLRQDCQTVLHHAAWCIGAQQGIGFFPLSVWGTVLGGRRFRRNR